jgi:hypothetical protein
MRHHSTLALLVGLASCGDLAPQQQATIRQVLTVACNVDGVVVPVAQPVVATLGPAGTKAANADLLVHPVVVAACKAAGGTPASALPVSPPETASPDAGAQPAP